MSSEDQDRVLIGSSSSSLSLSLSMYSEEAWVRTLYKLLAVQSPLSSWPVLEALTGGYLWRCTSSPAKDTKLRRGGFALKQN